ncbi:MAG TPA: bL35 family ribosomal protein [Thermoflexus sp.]|nr:bL35 family ribosomal protein [Thermoflexus sp.]
MPKIRTHKATAKRLRYTGSGKLVHAKTGRSHLRRKRPKRTKRLYDEMFVVEEPSVYKRVKRLAPYLEKQD